MNNDEYKFMIIADGNVKDDEFTKKIVSIFDRFKCEVTHIDVIGRKMLPEPSTDIALYVSVDTLIPSLGVTAVNDTLLEQKEIIRTMVIKR